jgi:hypothetical protein
MGLFKQRKSRLVAIIIFKSFFFTTSSVVKCLRILKFKKCFTFAIKILILISIDAASIVTKLTPSKSCSVNSRRSSTEFQSELNESISTKLVPVKTTEIF